MSFRVLRLFIAPISASIAALVFSSRALAETASGSEYMRVEGQRYSWFDTPQTASEGLVEQQQLKERAFLRPGEILESVPGLVTTQHSGTGKANQYFLRGFNLDHGTDFATTVDGIPINMASSAHGQGYNDINFLVPEAIQSIKYAKGPYTASVGDFSSAGNATIENADHFDRGTAKLTLGNYRYQRGLIMDSVALGSEREVSYVLEGTRSQGPWTDLHEDLGKKLGLLKFTQDTAYGTFKASLMHYDAKWNAANQVPARAVEAQKIDRLGSIEKTDGGSTKRQSLSLTWVKGNEQSDVSVQVYGVQYGLNLWTNPTYFLSDPVNGDQLEQEDRRKIFGGLVQARDTWHLASFVIKVKAGVQQRSDFIDQLGLYATNQRERIATKGDSKAQLANTGIFAEQEWNWTDSFRTNVGVRHDIFRFKVRDRLAELDGTKEAAITSPKLGIAFDVSKQLSLFANGGQSFHSNDARGVVNFGDEETRGERAPALVPSRGYEIGANFNRDDLLHLSLALWHLKLDSELIFVGDEGSTEASRASRRQGVDLLVQYFPSNLFHLDIEGSWADAKFTSDPDGEGTRVEGALPFVGSLGIGSQLSQEWSLGLRLRYFGRRPLTADGSHESDPTQVVNLHAAYAPGRWEFSADVLNLFQSKDHDIDYFYASRMAEESEGVEDVHYHPVEPTTFRGSVAYHF